jgi:hypothetical protein
MRLQQTALVPLQLPLKVVLFVQDKIHETACGNAGPWNAIARIARRASQ